MRTNVTLLDEAQASGSPGDSPTPQAEKPVHVDFSKKNRDGSPFQKAKSLKKRLKLFLWGDSGAGKTTLSLQFPKPVVIDLKGGADLYGESLAVYEISRVIFRITVGSLRVISSLASFSQIPQLTGGPPA